MTNPTNPVRRLLDAVQRRFVRSRPGSVLILVVALLVLIALAGTALISTARVDRYAVAQHSANTQIDLLVEGVVRMTKAALIDDLFAGNKYRPARLDPDNPPPPPAAFDYSPGRYEHADSPLVDWHLASRTPEVANNLPVWRAVSGSLVGINQPFEDPRDGRITALRDNAYPTAVQHVVGGTTRDFPALTIVGAGSPILAGDADGDGIADGGLWKLPIGPINGITYYVCYRVIDNGSAINLSTAMQANDAATVFAATPVVPGNLFSSNIDLLRTLYQDPMSAAVGYTSLRQMYKLDYWRHGVPNFNASAVPPAAPLPFDPDTVFPVDETGNTRRMDFAWISVYDQFYHQLGRRLANPGYSATKTEAAPGGLKFRPITEADAKALAYKFVLRNPNTSPPSMIEQTLLPTLELPKDPTLLTAAPTPLQPRTRTRPFLPTETVQWFAAGFNYADPTGAYSRRPLMTARNPVANLAPVPTFTEVDPQNTTTNPVAEPFKMPNRLPENPTPRVSINTAEFGELWRGFYSVMNAPNIGAYQQFRSSRRDPTGTSTLPPSQMVLLRSAQAAVAAIDIRDSDTDVTSRVIYLNTGTAAEPVKKVTVFGTEPQPFITEVYVNNENVVPFQPPVPPPASPFPGDAQGQANPKGYIAIELFNPYTTRINVTGWKLALLNRNAASYAGAGQGGQMVVRTITGLRYGLGMNDNTGVRDEDITIEPGRHLVLHNFAATGDTPGPNSARHVPLAAQRNATVNGIKYVHVANLHECLPDPSPNTPKGSPIGYELVLMRPRRSDGKVIGTAAAPQPHPWDTNAGFTEGAAAGHYLHEWVPIDSFDFSAVVVPPAGDTSVRLAPPTGPYRAWHYVRANDQGQNRWKCVYPGRWRPATPAGEGSRHEGTQVGPTWGQNAPDPWSVLLPAPLIALGAADGASTYPHPFQVPIQINNKDFGGPNKLTLATKQRFPFGNFARNGDILQVPFLGAYRIDGPTMNHPDLPTVGGPPLPAVPGIGELNALALDCASADDLVPATDVIEHVGRFCPINYLDPGNRYSAAPVPDTYEWAADLFDHLGVQNPHDDYTPNTDPRRYAVWNGTMWVAAGDPQPVRNGTAANPNAGEELEPVEGLININTANWRVLATLPFIPLGLTDTNADGIRDYPDSDADGVNDNAEIAQMIVRYRDGDPTSTPPIQPAGPFYSIFDLNRVVAYLPNGQPDLSKTFQNANGAIVNMAAYDFDDPEGDLSPYGEGQKDGVLGDFEGRFLMLNRVSNMITTRSDYYTCYILVQGWRGAGTTAAELVVQRRVAFFADRSTVSPTNRDFAPSLIPTE